MASQCARQAAMVSPSPPAILKEATVPAPASAPRMSANAGQAGCGLPPGLRLLARSTQATLASELGTNLAQPQNPAVSPTCPPRWAGRNQITAGLGSVPSAVNPAVSHPTIGCPLRVGPCRSPEGPDGRAEQRSSAGGAGYLAQRPVRARPPTR